MGGKACDLQHAKDNGCTIPAGNNIPTTTVGSKKYLCYDFEGCKAGYPVKVCTFAPRSQLGAFRREPGDGKVELVRVEGRDDLVHERRRLPGKGAKAREVEARRG
jgi:hypothetical protein